MTTAWNDVVFGVRTALRTPVATAAIVLTLAFGIAANTVAFSFINSFFVRPPAVRDPARLVRIYSSVPGGMEYFTVSYGDYTDIRALPVLAAAAAVEPMPATLGVAGAHERVWAERASVNYLEVLGVAPVVGRPFAEADADTGAARVAIIGQGLARRAFGDGGAAGETLIVDGAPVTVIGVLPEHFRGTNLGIMVDVWLPLIRDRELASARGGGRFFILGRLRPGNSVRDVHAALDLLGSRLETLYPANRGVRFQALPESQGRVHPFARPGVLAFSLAFAGITLLVLVAACVNLAGVLLARAVFRGKEIAIRVALGATRGRIVAQLLTESAVVTAAGGALGVALSWIAVSALAAVPLPAARGAPIAFDFGLDGRVLAVSVLLTVLSALLFALAPALFASRRDVLPGLKTVAVTAPFHHRRLRDLLVGAQIAVSIVLLMAGGLLLRNFEAARHIHPGFTAHGVVVASVEWTDGGTAPATDHWRRVADRVAALGGVESVALADRVPFEANITVMAAAAEGNTPLPSDSWPPINYAIVDARYFETMRIPVLEGREFTAHDDSAAPPKVMVNDVLARRFWRESGGVGKRLVQRDGMLLEVIGVAATVKHLALGEEPVPYLYRPLAQTGAKTMIVIARTSTPHSAAFFRDMRAALRSVDDRVAVYNMATMQDRMRLAYLPATSGAAVSTVMSIVSLLLTATGLYGAVAFAVSRRTHEIGVRRTLGARPRQVMWLVLRPVLVSAVAGAAAGISAGLILSRALRPLLFEVSVLDPLILAGVPVVTIAVCAGAALPPAARAGRVEPAIALRAD